jgi:predicted kinase
VKGQPGSGKSTLGFALAAALRWPLIDKDSGRSAMQHLATAHPSIDWNSLSYDVMWRYAEAQLACKLSAIVDCPFARRQLFDTAAALANKV